MAKPAKQCNVPEQDRPPACLRCGTAMVWIHSSWQCPGCKFKEGCCG